MLEINNTNRSSIDSLVEWKQLRKETLNLKIWQQKLPKLKSKGGGGGGGGKEKKKNWKKKRIFKKFSCEFSIFIIPFSFSEGYTSHLVGNKVHSMCL